LKHSTGVLYNSAKSANQNKPQAIMEKIRPLALISNERSIPKARKKHPTSCEVLTVAPPKLILDGLNIARSSGV
jgi:hypothetical protein